MVKETIVNPKVGDLIIGCEFPKEYTVIIISIVNNNYIHTYPVIDGATQRNWSIKGFEKWFHKISDSTWKNK